MPIVLSQAEVQKRGGKYLPTKARPQPEPKPEPPPPVVVKTQDPVHMDRVASVVAVGQEVVAERLAQVVGLLEKSGGSWDVDVTARDEDGRISRLRFTKVQ